MPFALVTIGLMMIVTGARDTHIQFGEQLKSDLTGSQNFLQYALAIGTVGSLGYVSDLRSISNLLMSLIILSLILSNQGVFRKLQDALAAGPESPMPPKDAKGDTKDFVTPSTPLEDGANILRKGRDLIFGPNWLKIF